MNERLRNALLLGAWAFCLAVGLASSAVFVAGVLRDTHFGQAEIAMDLGRAGAWKSDAFRVWGGGDYVLWLTTFVPQPPFDPNAPLSSAGSVPPARFDGQIEVRVLTPDAEEHRAWTPGAPGGPPFEHVAGEGGTWTRLAEVALTDLPLRPWRLEARTLVGAPAFDDARFTSRLLLRPDRPDPGMGGLINYAMIVPAGVFLALSLGLARLYARRSGRNWPVWTSGLSLAAFVAFFTLR